MPVRSSNSAVLKWPHREHVDRAVRVWGHAQAKGHPELVRLGYFGSYARGDWGVGSDLDLVAVVTASDEEFARRAADWDTTTLPVPVELLVYTAAEWEALLKETSRFAQVLRGETVWIFERR
jgi:uncharacterized protein